MDDTDLFGETLATETRVYIEEYDCEMPPTDCTLEDWALHFSGRHALDDPSQSPRELDGAKLKAYRVVYAQVCAARNADGSYDIPELPQGFEFHAVCYGSGLGWSPDYLIDDRAHALELLQEFGDSPYEYIAIRKADQVEGIVHFQSTPVPACRFVAVEAEDA